MATLQRFKQLATQCTVAPSPTRSPAASPVIHLRRRKTLRMLFGSTGRRKLHSRETSVPIQVPAPDGSRKFRVRYKLKDLFISSPPPPLEGGSPHWRGEDGRDRHLFPKEPYSGGEFSGRRGGGGSIRPLSAALRRRMLRKAWRPILVAIPE
ncbi:hypothetical protein SAY87_014108 [Trapa incisa]|uniref:Uncharacterized protein n=1 Tax=Trapa incisa TaxID=236973 RepID=A0AAN7H2H8_9MYRT|nr:hypothetical protein SAY87_014108 [Trapa incisa]